MEKEYQISWLKIVGITFLIAVIVIIICLLYPKKDNTLLTQQTYIDNITLMKNAGFEYFRGSNLPEEIGEQKRISLDEMLARNLLPEFLDEEGNSCDTGNSYIETTKTLDNEYEMSVYLSCNNKSDYIVTSISDVVCTDCNVIVPDDSDRPSDSNNSSSSNNNSNNSGSNSSERPIEITHTTNVNINYVNTCCTDGSSSNCDDNCLNNVYHSVVFDSNGGSSVRTQTVKHGEQALYRSTYRYGYEFLGWYLDGEKYDFNTPVTEKIILEAKWKKKDNEKPIEPDDNKEIYIVDFDSNGGSRVASKKVVEGDAVTRPNDPTKDCYDFVGWYTNEAFTKRYDFSTPVTHDMTLYAKWRDDGTCKETYRVKFDSNGGSSVATQRVEEGDRAYEPNDPKRNGYEFLGWYLNGRRFSFNTRIYEDITLEAKWEKEETKYNKYCKIENDTYYSTGYIGIDETRRNFTWDVKFNKLRNVENLKVVDVGHITSLSMYNEIYQNAYRGNLSMVGGNDDYSVAITSGSMLKRYSLKSSNFTPSVGTPYYKNGYWYATLSIRIRNLNNLTAYYANNINSWIYFTPFYFEVEYTDLNNCVTDKASNSYKYDDYEIVDSYWK